MICAATSATVAGLRRRRFAPWHAYQRRRCLHPAMQEVPARRWPGARRGGRGRGGAGRGGRSGAAAEPGLIDRAHIDDRTRPRRQRRAPAAPARTRSPFSSRSATRCRTSPWRASRSNGPRRPGAASASHCDRCGAARRGRAGRGGATVLFVLGAAVGWGTIGSAYALLLRDASVSPLTLVFIRALSASAALGLFLPIWRRDLLVVRPRDLPFLRSSASSASASSTRSDLLLQLTSVAIRDGAALPRARVRDARLGPLVRRDPRAAEGAGAAPLPDRRAPGGRALAGRGAARERARYRARPPLGAGLQRVQPAGEVRAAAPPTADPALLHARLRCPRPPAGATDRRLGASPVAGPWR